MQSKLLDLDSDIYLIQKSVYYFIAFIFVEG